jgi:hypothetical protein
MLWLSGVAGFDPPHLKQIHLPGAAASLLPLATSVAADQLSDGLRSSGLQ